MGSSQQGRASTKYGWTTKVVVSGAEGEVTVSKVDPCSICGKQVMANSVLCANASLLVITLLKIEIIDFLS